MAQQSYQSAATNADDTDFSKQSRMKWNATSQWYSRYERYEIPAVIQCAELTDLPNKTGAVIEVGCGSGLQSEVLAKAFLKGHGSLLVSCDFSTAMISMMEQRYDQSTFQQTEGNKVVIDRDTDYADPACTQQVQLDQIRAQQAPFDKLVFGCMADNMRLPFANEAFEAYVSNLSLQIVQHRERQISEAYRVLKPGSRACFTIWGRPENCLIFYIRR